MQDFPVDVMLCQCVFGLPTSCFVTVLTIPVLAIDIGNNMLNVRNNSVACK